MLDDEEINMRRRSPAWGDVISNCLIGEGGQPMTRRAYLCRLRRYVVARGLLQSG